MAKRGHDQTNANNVKQEEVTNYVYDASKIRKYGDHETIKLRLLMFGRQCFYLVGKGAENLKRLKQEYWIKITGLNGHTNYRAVTVEGTRKNCINCLREIMTHCTEGPFLAHNFKKSTKEINLLLHHDCVGAIVGKGGAQIKELSDQSRCKLKAYPDCLPNSNEQVIAIGSDSEEKVIGGLERILDIVTKFPSRMRPLYYVPDDSVMPIGVGNQNGEQPSGGMRPPNPQKGMGRGYYNQMGMGPNNQMGMGPNNQMGMGPNNRMGPGPNQMGPGPNQMGPGPNRMGQGPNRMGPGPNQMGPGFYDNQRGMGPNNQMGMMGPNHHMGNQPGMGMGQGAEQGYGDPEAPIPISQGEDIASLLIQIRDDSSFNNTYPQPDFQQQLTRTEVSVPNEMCGSIIGSGGCNLRSIRETSGASIKINQTPKHSKENRTITLEGTQEQIQIAEQLMMQCARGLEPFHQYQEQYQEQY